MFLMGIMLSPVLGQDIKLTFEKSENIDNEPDSVLVRDINGEICSMAIIKSNLPGIRFYSNLGIEKVVHDYSMYRIWFPASAASLKIVVPGFSLYEHPLEYKGKSMVYIFILDVSEPDIIVSYKADSVNKITISTFPVTARLKLGDRKLGRTPFFLDNQAINSDSVLTIVKSGHFKSEIACDTLKPGASYQIRLMKFSERRRYYFDLTGGIIIGFGDPVFGLQIGQLGKFGYYISGKTMYRNGNTSGPERDLSWAVSGGISKSIYRVNFYIGAGYYNSDEYYYFQQGESVGQKGFMADLGLIVNIGPSFIMSVNTNIRKGNPIEFDYVPFDISFGIGWAF